MCETGRRHLWSNTAHGEAISQIDNVSGEMKGELLASHLFCFLLFSCENYSLDGNTPNRTVAMPPRPRPRPQPSSSQFNGVNSILLWKRELQPIDHMCACAFVVGCVFVCARTLFLLTDAYTPQNNLIEYICVSISLDDECFAAAVAYWPHSRNRTQSHRFIAAAFFRFFFLFKLLERSEFVIDLN